MKYWDVPDSRKVSLLAENKDGFHFLEIFKFFTIIREIQLNKWKKNTYLPKEIKKSPTTKNKKTQKNLRKQKGKQFWKNKTQYIELFKKHHASETVGNVRRGAIYCL